MTCLSVCLTRLLPASSICTHASLPPRRCRPGPPSEALQPPCVYVVNHVFLFLVSHSALPPPSRSVTSLLKTNRDRALHRAIFVITKMAEVDISHSNISRYVYTCEPLWMLFHFWLQLRMRISVIYVRILINIPFCENTWKGRCSLNCRTFFICSTVLTLQ